MKLCTGKWGCSTPENPVYHPPLDFPLKQEGRAGYRLQSWCYRGEQRRLVAYRERQKQGNGEPYLARERERMRAYRERQKRFNRENYLAREAARMRDWRDRQEQP